MTAREERRAKERAKTALIAALAPLVDLSTLTEGEHGFDYCVDTPVRGCFELDHRITEIELDINERFGVSARVLTIPRIESPPEAP
jgi:hypothetical protein